MLAIGLIEEGNCLFSMPVETDDVGDIVRILQRHAGQVPDQILIVEFDCVVAHYNRGEDFGEEE